MDERCDYYLLMADQLENNPLLALEYIRRAFLIRREETWWEIAFERVDEAGLEGRAACGCVRSSTSPWWRTRPRVWGRRAIFERYREALGDLRGLTFQPEAERGRHTRWLTCLLVEKEAFGADRKAVRLAPEQENIESRPLWKPMHMQPLYRGCDIYGGAVAESLFERGLCLPSGSSLIAAEQDRVVKGIRRVAEIGRL